MLTVVCRDEPVCCLLFVVRCLLFVLQLLCDLRSVVCDVCDQSVVCVAQCCVCVVQQQCCVCCVRVVCVSVDCLLHECTENCTCEECPVKTFRPPSADRPPPDRPTPGPPPRPRFSTLHTLETPFMLRRTLSHTVFIVRSMPKRHAYLLYLPEVFLKARKTISACQKNNQTRPSYGTRQPEERHPRADWSGLAQRRPPKFHEKKKSA